MLKKLAAEAAAVLTSFWGTDRRQMLCTALIEHFLPLTVILACNDYMLTDPAPINTINCTICTFVGKFCVHMMAP